MKILMITWEFPPYIAGGLGMACYGLVKSLLSQGVQVDLVLPTKEEVYFPMRKPEDADIMPIRFFDESKKSSFVTQNISNLCERLKTVGAYASPESYFTADISGNATLENFYELLTWTNENIVDSSIEKLHVYLKGEEPIFRKVQEITQRLIKFSNKFHYDAIHANDWLTFPAGLTLKKILNLPLVSHIHATEFDRAGGIGDERIHNIEYAGLSSADQVIAVSKYTARMVIDRYGIKPSKINVIHNAYTVSSDPVFERKQIFKDPVILFMGRITIQKGPDYFVEVAEKVLKHNEKVRFIMAGTGDMFSKILKLSAAKRLKDRFLFAGFLDREQVENILLASDIFVLPSVSEPFGIVPLEAMAFGAAVIVSKQSGVSEVVDNVFKVDFWDVDKTVEIITMLLDDPEKRKNIAIEGQREVLKIGWQSAAQKTIDVYKGLGCYI